MTFLKRIKAVAQKEWLEILRDRVFFSLAFVVPIVVMLLLGYGLSLDVENIPFSIVDYDNTFMSRDYAHKFIDSRYFDFKGYAENEKSLVPLITDNKIRAAIIIPPKFQKNLKGGKPASVQTLIDGTFPFRAQTTKGYVIAINSSASIKMLASYISEKKGITLKSAEKKLRPVKLQIRYLYNQSVKSIWSLAPKLIMVILMVSPPFLTALGVVREKESGAIYNIYVSTVTRAEFLVGKLLPYVTISAVNSVILFLMARFLFQAPFKGNLIFFFAVTIIYVVCTTGIGLLVSVLVRTQIAAMIVTAIVTILPAVLYSGIIIPVSSLTTAARIFAHLIPAMYYTNIVMGCFLKGIGFSYLWKDVAILSLYASLLLLTGYLLFHKRTKA